MPDEKWTRFHIVFKDGKDGHYYMEPGQFKRFEQDLVAFMENSVTASTRAGAYDVAQPNQNGPGPGSQPRRLIVSFTDIHHIG